MFDMVEHDALDDFNTYENEIARRHRVAKRLAIAEEMEDADIDERMYERWEEQRW